MNYKLIKNPITNEVSAIKLSLDNDMCVSIPIDEKNRYYQEYLEWLAEGNEPEPADEV